MKNTKFTLITVTCLMAAFLSAQGLAEEVDAASSAVPTATVSDKEGSPTASDTVLNEVSEKEKIETTDISHADQTENGELFKTQYEDGDWEDYGTSHVGTTPGSVSVTFVGHAAEVYAEKTSWSGVVDVHLDDEKVGSFDSFENASYGKEGTLVYRLENLPEKEHTLRLLPLEGSFYFHSGVKVYHHPLPYTHLDVEPKEMILDSVSSKQLSVDAFPKYATETITYTTSNPAIVKVNDTGKVEAVGVGEAEITIAGKEVIQTIPVMVIPAENNVHVVYGTIGQHTRQDEYETVLSQDSIGAMRDSAWLGDELHKKIVLATKNQVLTNVRVTSSDFISEEGRISAAALTAYVVRETQGHIGRGGIWGQIPGKEVPREMIPDILDKASTFTIDKERLQPIWLKLAVPNDAVTGSYTGKVKITADNLLKPIEIDYTFDVKQLKRDQENRFSMELWQYPFTVARYYAIPEEDLFGEQHLAILRQELSEYVKLGGTAVTTTISEDPWHSQTYDRYPSMVKWTRKEDGHFEFDFTLFDRYVTLAIELGINRQIKSFSLTPWENQVSYFDEKSQQTASQTLPTGSEAWRAVWGEFLESYIRHLDEKGWFDITYLAMDERPLKDMDHVLALVQNYRNKDGKRLKLSAAMNYSAEKEALLNEIDDISIDLAQIQDPDAIRQLTANRREKGFTTTLYTCVGDYPSSFSRSAPIESAWTLWYAASLGMDGYLRWAYDAWVKDPLVNIDHWWWESGDPFLIYPSDKESEDKTPRTSPRFEQFKMAKAQIEKLHFLKTLSPDAKKEIEALLGSVTREYGQRNPYGAMESTGLQQDRAVETEVERLNNAANHLFDKYAFLISPLAEGYVPIAETHLSAASTQEGEENALENALDQDAATIWHSEWQGRDIQHLWLVADVGKNRLVDGLAYMARGDGGVNGKMQQYEIYTSQDGQNWTSVKKGQLTEQSGWQEIHFSPTVARYVKLQAVHTVGDGNREDRFMSVAEFRVHEAAFQEELVSIPFEQIRRENPELSVGEQRNIQAGVLGERIRFYQLIKEGEETIRRLVSEQVIKEPQREIIEIGTKKEGQPLADSPRFDLAEYPISITEEQTIRGKQEEPLPKQVSSNSKELPQTGENRDSEVLILSLMGLMAVYGLQKRWKKEK